VSLSGDGAKAREFRRVMGDATDEYDWALRWRGHISIQARVARFGIACDRKHGHIQTATKPTHVTALHALHDEAHARSLAADVEWLKGHAIQGMVESPLYLAGLVNRRNTHPHPLNLVLGKAQAASPPLRPRPNRRPAPSTRRIRRSMTTGSCSIITD